MKTAIYIEDGRTQLVLTPETVFEKAICEKVDRGEHSVKIYLGDFYACEGGWTRMYDSPHKSESLIIVMDIKP